MSLKMEKDIKKFLLRCFAWILQDAENLRGVKFLLCKLYFDCFPAKSVECEKGKQ